MKSKTMKVLGVLLAIAMLAGMMPAAGITAFAAEYSSGTVLSGDLERVLITD